MTEVNDSRRVTVCARECVLCLALLSLAWVKILGLSVLQLERGSSEQRGDVGEYHVRVVVGVGLDLVCCVRTRAGESEQARAKDQAGSRKPVGKNHECEGSASTALYRKVYAQLL